MNKGIVDHRSVGPAAGATAQWRRNRHRRWHREAEGTQLVVGHLGGGGQFAAAAVLGHVPRGEELEVGGI